MQTILVIDDEKIILNLLQAALSGYGYQVEIASGGQEGISKFNRGQVDLVITDGCMPDVDGNEVARYIRSSAKRRTPIIAISGSPWKLEKRYFDQVLCKPFPLKTLFDVVSSLTGRTHRAMAMA